ncbi:hypothetical protein [Methylobacterium sp. CM6257]
MTGNIVLHIGPHKTGTTAIQRMLFSQSIAKDCEFVYPFVSPDEIGQHTFAQLACDPMRPEFSEMLKVLKSTAKTCILSSEELCYLPDAGMRRLRKALPDANVTIAYYQRDILSLLQSWWQEKIKHGSTQTLLEFSFACLLAPQHLHLLVPDTLLSGWASVFGRDAIRIFRYDHIPDVARQFACDFLSLELPVEALTASNRSYDHLDCEMIRFWNMHGFWGAGVIQSPDYHEVRAELVERSGEFSEKFSLDYGRKEFSGIEDILISRWGDRIEGFDGGRLFHIREKSYSYIRPDFWAANPDFLKEMREFALQRPAYSQRK